MRYVADLHIHSRFSRAVSREMTLAGISRWAGKKGIDLVATGDWTHPMWMKEIAAELSEDGSGFLSRKTAADPADGRGSVKFLLSTEISCIFSQAGKTRRVHTLVWVPTIAAAVAIGRALTNQGCNLMSDGRPIIGLSLQQLAETVLTAEPSALIVPAHIWTPWFSVYGSMGGFPTLADAFGEYASHIHAVETGLSSSPDMNWRIPELDARSIVSFSDAHSGPKLGRELTVFELAAPTFGELTSALKYQATGQGASCIASTVEFYPEEGKYHFTGHRDCHIRFDPEETKAKGMTCPVCGKPLTQGVMQRVEELSGRPAAALMTQYASSPGGSREIRSGAFPRRPPFIMLVPLLEVIAEGIGSPVTSKKTGAIYDRLGTKLGSEYRILTESPLDEIARESTPQVAEGIGRVRRGEIVIDPGYDGVFGVVRIWKSDRDRELVDRSREQLGLF